jgi:hypothetical protein
VGFAPGVEASLVRYGQSGCARYDANLPFECNCETPHGHGEYGILAESGEDACVPLLDFCMSGTEPVFEGPAECFDTQATSDSSSCYLNQVCATPMRLTDDVRLASLETRTAGCDRVSSGSQCNCSLTYGYSSFDFVVSSLPSANTCTLAAANCDEGADIRPIGEPDCQPASRSAELDSCDSILTCPQEVSVNGRNVVANGHIVVACARVAAGQPWRCSCASGQETAIFELGAASSSSWDACGLAPAGCLDRIPVHIGPYGPLEPPPDPLGEH